MGYQLAVSGLFAADQKLPYFWRNLVTKLAFIRAAEQVLGPARKTDDTDKPR